MELELGNNNKNNNNDDDATVIGEVEADKKPRKRVKKEIPLCTICDTPYNKSNALPVQCEYCDFVACRSCCQTYILSQPAPKCMNPSGTCGRQWTPHFMRRTMTLKFMLEDWREHRMNIIFDIERSMLPEAQQLIELRHLVDGLLDNGRKIESEINKLRRDLEFNARRLFAMRHRIQHRETTGQDDPQLSVVYDPRQRGATPEENNDCIGKYVRPCPGEDCRGFLNKSWICAMCRTKVCSSCHEIVGKHYLKKRGTSSEPEAASASSVEENEDEDQNEEETEKEQSASCGHVCKPENIASAKEVMSHSKPCPKCNVFIFKIDGCNQMFCTHCNTAFDWRTRTISNGPIHNPHYFAWRASRAAAAAANNEPATAEAEVHRFVPGCMNGQPEELDEFINVLFRLQNRVRRIDTKFSVSFPFSKLSEIARMTIHLKDVIMRKYAPAGRPVSENLRVRYLEKDIDEAMFKQLVYKNEFAEMKKQAYFQLFEVLADSVTDILVRMSNGLRSLYVRDSEIYFDKEVHLTPFLLEIYAVVDYTNTHLAEIPVTYNSNTRYHFNPSMAMKSIAKSAIIPCYVQLFNTVNSACKLDKFELL